MVRVFTSYKREHRLTAEVKSALLPMLLEFGYTAEIDEDIRGGDRWSDELYKWLLECSAAVVILSKEAHESTWCKREWEVLAARAKVQADFRLVPILLSDSVGYPEVFSDFQHIKYDSNYLWLDKVRERLAGLKSWRVGKQEYLALHRAWLTSKYEVLPAIGQEAFTLKSTFAELECGSLTWGEITRSDQWSRSSQSPHGALDPFDEKNGGRLPLLETTLQLIDDPTYRDAIVIQGPAGAGKSSFCLRVAHELQNRGYHPLMIRFRDLRLSTFDRVDELLTDACRVGPEEESPPLPTSKLIDDTDWREFHPSAKPQICRTVVILDAWDEVTIGGNTGYQAQLSTWLPKIRQYILKNPGPPMRLIVTGRPSLEVRESGFLERDTRVLTIRPLSKTQFEALATQTVTHADWGLTKERVAPVLEKYGNERSLEVLNYPLLALLGLRTLSRFKGTADELLSLLSSPTALYKELVDQTAEKAGKYEDALQGTIHKGGRSLRGLIQQAAAMITVMGGERISFDELSARFEDTLHVNQSTLENWVETGTKDNPFHRLVVNFLFKGGHRDLGCEFLHKSFREYLFAECVVGVLESAKLDKSSEALPYWQDFPEGSSAYEISRQLARLLAPNWMTKEVRGHVFWLLEQAIDADRVRWVQIRDLLADVYGWWAEGVHLRRQPKKERGQLRWIEPFIDELSSWVMPYEQRHLDPPRNVALDAHLGDALMQITAFVHSKLTAEPANTDRVYQDCSNDQHCRFRPGGKGYFCNLVSRIDVGSSRPLGRRCSGSWLRGISLKGETLQSELFSRAELQGAILSGTSLSGTQFESALMQRVDFSDAIVARCNFNDSDLTDATLHAEQLFSANIFEDKFHPTNYRISSPKFAITCNATWRNAVLPKTLEFLEHHTETFVPGTMIVDAAYNVRDISEAQLKVIRGMSLNKLIRQDLAAFLLAARAIGSI